MRKYQQNEKTLTRGEKTSQMRIYRSDEKIAAAGYENATQSRKYQPNEKTLIEEENSKLLRKY
jgi:hypothetical protein